jgi:CRISPR-associated endonuclease/helicase Cas3
MPRIDSDTKQKRIELTYACLERNPNGLTEGEVAGMVSFERRTVNNYLRELETQGKVYKEGRLWIALPYQRTRLRRLDLSPEEAMTLYLATRLLVKQHDKRNESAETALIKLAEALTGDANVGHEVYQAARELAHRPGDVAYSAVFRTIMQGYIYRRKVAVTYVPLGGKPFETVLSPYLLEPSAIGYATYVIGHSEIVNALRTYKLQRIEQATLTRHEYAIPPDFPGLDYLRSAWSIISGDELVSVRLRFTPRVTRRVRESRWHPSQDIETDPEHPGGCIWTAQVADLTDFVPWVRSWGADVEVLEPESLRAELIDEARRLATTYKVAEIEPPPLYQLLWAKTDRRTSRTHPLICHMIDVAQVALALWNDVLTDSIRAQFADALGLGMDAAGRLIAFWAGLHDLGKASPAFQRKYAPAEPELSEGGLVFPHVFARESFSHGAATARALPALLEAETGLPRRQARAVARAIGGHHGAWPIPGDMQQLKSTQLGDEGWSAVQRELFVALAGCLNPRSIGQFPADRTERGALWTLLSGLTSVADWIGSMSEHFRFARTPVDPGQYAKHAAKQARHALDALHWTDWSPPTEAMPFAALFGVPAPRPMQAQVIQLAEKLDRPSLVIIEAPTGVGKTEAALYLADHWVRTQQQRGLYVAMPTMATSNQMFGRTTDTLARRYPQGQARPLLVHSQARWIAQAPPPDVQIADEQPADTAGSVDAMAWFLPRKRSLLAPFAVGTVDQTLLSVLQTRHFFVRLFGLSHKTVIFDEVHAYDTYMSTLFQRLLGWLRAVGASVVLLSATLPEKTRRELLRAYGGEAVRDLPSAPYPSITWAMAGQVGVVPVAAPESRSLELEWVGRAPEVIAERLKAELREGGCAAVICNTVRRSQQVYRAVREAQIVPDDDLVLFHARFPFGVRKAIEDEVLARFGKDAGEGRRRGIVVATQVIEQSLDLDFDLMVTDLAPLDLVLQRAGRLHRHERAHRPPPLNAPRLLLAGPPLEDGVPTFERGESYVYEPYILLRSYLALQGRTALALPEDTADLIEAVYGPTMPSSDLVPAMQEALAQALERIQDHDTKETYQARMRLIATPQSDDLLTKSNQGLAEDSPGVHQAFQALTRLGPPSISLVCLHQTEHGLYTGPNGSGRAVDLERHPGRDLTQALVEATVSVSHWGVLNHYREQEPPPGWREHPLLQRYHAAVFRDGLCPLQDAPFALCLSELGLEVVSADPKGLPDD